MMPLIIIGAVFVGVSALVWGVALMFRGGGDQAVEDRLSMLTSHGAGKGKDFAGESVLYESLDEKAGFFETHVARWFNLSLLLEQADSPLTASRFLAITGGLFAGGVVVSLLAGLHFALAPVIGLSLGACPLTWTVFRRRRRLKAFAAQMPDALELIARALRSGHSLASGFSLVSSEMSAPLGEEFLRVYEEQNLGISLEEALEGMTERVPNLDLKFFSTAVILQRQTGGDLAEILDKIGYIIRERFKIWGQVQALTGEGRLSGIVLLALPPVLFLAVYKLNPEYISVLFTESMGKQMLAAAAVMQVLGALVIRKIINIKV
jgi:tight adherence protein B